LFSLYQRLSRATDYRRDDVCTTIIAVHQSLTLLWHLCREKRAQRGTLGIPAIDTLLIRTQGVVTILPLIPRPLLLLVFVTSIAVSSRLLLLLLLICVLPPMQMPTQVRRTTTQWHCHTGLRLGTLCWPWKRLLESRTGRITTGASSRMPLRLQIHHLKRNTISRDLSFTPQQLEDMLDSQRV